MNEQALKARLKYIANNQEMTFQQAWEKLILERFLFRVSQSKYCDNLIFKGGLLLSYYLFIGRETRDVDFSVTNILVSKANIENIIAEICSISMNDGLTYKFKNSKTLTQPHMNYPGFRVNCDVNFGYINGDLQIDIGVGDQVKPTNELISQSLYKSKPIFDGEISLQVYPLETIFAEKLETIVFRGADNSRMKDFHDVLAITRNYNKINKQRLIDSIQRTFNYRETKISLPLKFKEQDIRQLQKLWSRHFNTLSEVTETLNIPKNFKDVVEEINECLDKNVLKGLSNF